jgi:hypothetical protein
MYDELIKDPDAYMRGIFDCGWVDEWDEAEVEALRKALHKMATSEPQGMVFALSEFSLDPEGFNNAEDYKGLLISLCRNFDIELATEDVIAEPAQGIEVSVKTPDGILSYTPDGADEDGWLRDDFLDFVNDELLPALGEERVFFVLPPAEVQVEMVFQYVDVLEAAMDNGVIPDDEYFM